MKQRILNIKFLFDSAKVEGVVTPAEQQTVNAHDAIDVTGHGHSDRASDEHVASGPQSIARILVVLPQLISHHRRCIVQILTRKHLLYKANLLKHQQPNSSEGSRCVWMLLQHRIANFDDVSIFFIWTGQRIFNFDDVMNIRFWNVLPVD